MDAFLFVVSIIAAAILTAFAGLTLYGLWLSLKIFRRMIKEIF